MYADNCCRCFSVSFSCACACAYACIAPIYKYDATMQASTREWKSFHSLLLVLMLASLRRTCKPGRRTGISTNASHKALTLASHRFTSRFLMLVPASYE